MTWPSGGRHVLRASRKTAPSKAGQAQLALSHLGHGVERLPGLRPEGAFHVSVSEPSVFDDDDLPDLDIDEAGKFLSDPPLSRRSMYRLAKEGRVKSYRMLGKRLFERPSLKAFRAECRAAGPQLLEPASLTGAKRRRGRPAKDRAEAPCGRGG